MTIYDHTKLCVGNALMEIVHENNPLKTVGKIDMVGDDMIARGTQYAVVCMLW